MNPNWLGVTAAILAILGFIAAHRFALKVSLKSRLVLLALAVVLAVPGASFAIYYAHLFPEPDWYYQFRSIRGTELLMVFVGLAGGVAAAILPRALLVLPLLGVAAIAVAPIIKPLTGPIPAGLLVQKWKDGICLQSTPSTCGAASLATILTYLGKDTTEEQVAVEAHSYSGGTEAWYLARAARARGVEVQYNFTQGFSSESPFPAIVGVKLGPIGHFIPILKREVDKYLIGDPLKGRELLTQDQLLRRYEFTGFRMLFGKQH